MLRQQIRIKMKMTYSLKRLTALTFIGLATSSASMSAILTVDNNPTHDADFRQLQPAIDAATEGDILHLIGSADEYETATLNKRLTIYGPGYFLSANPETQASPVSAKVKSSFNVDASGSGSLISGVSFTTTVRLMSASNTTFQRCLFGSTVNVEPGAVNNIFIQNYFERGMEIFNGASDVLIANNIFTSSSNSPTTWIDMNTSGANATIKNNTFDKGNRLFLNDSVFTNNLLLNFQGLNSGLNNTVSSENLTASDLLTLFGALDESILTEWNTTGSVDGIYQMEGVTNPSLDTIGAFSGDTPYVLSGIPVIPNIYVLETPATVDRHNGLRVRIKARTNL